MPATPRNLRLPAELAVGADFARHARDLGSENAELLNHRVGDIGRPQELSFQRTPIHVQAHNLSQIALRDGRDGASNFRGGAQQVLDESVDRNLHLSPGAL